MVSKIVAETSNDGFMLNKSISVPIDANSNGSKKSQTWLVVVSTFSWKHNIERNFVIVVVVIIHFEGSAIENGMSDFKIIIIGPWNARFCGRLVGDL